MVDDEDPITLKSRNSGDRVGGPEGLEGLAFSGQCVSGFYAAGFCLA
jgi:hypothetical protein